VLIEAARAVGHDRPDVLFDGADGPSLLDPSRLQAAADRIRSEATAPNDVVNPDGPVAAVPRIGDGDTTHLCAVDADGFGISLTQSNALDFGSHLVAGTTGIFLHNRGVGFSLEPGHPAELAPGQRPPHTLSPMLVTAADGALTHLVGAMGGDGQPQIILQLLARLLVAGQDPSTAIASARFSLDAPSAGPFRLWWGDDLTVMLEAHAPARWITRLSELGHRVRSISAYAPTDVGCAQIISVIRDGNGTPTHFTGATDPRSPEGAAVVR
jgi:gamma-glutamyltranspeptidase/glutathione hydrolase